ncbi:hypothetical protein [Streptomyces griseosporeus]|uniref:hypothetical protein n=1 Tax=Streptomyces griseosporeus TaxID=1910 RepID=UPI0036F56DDD
MTDIQQGTDATGSTDSADDRPRGRHRRRPPRKAALVAGGLVLAAGALSLVRLAPETGVPGLGTAEAEPQHRPGEEHATGRSTAVPSTPVPKASPSSTDVMGTVSPLPTPSATAAPSTAPAPAPAHVSMPAVAPRTSTPPAGTPSRSVPVPRPSAGTTTTPAPPAPPPSQPSPTPTPAPQPDEPDDPGLCVPILGLCIDLG